jgi:hypothetical protein
MSNQSMASGDPWCVIHGFSPCGCKLYPYYGQPMLTAQQSNFALCGECGKHQGTCICGGSSDPWADRARLTAQVREGTQISMDVTKPQVEVPIKKWADELREIAIKADEHRDYEGFSAYIYMLERCKLAAKRGDCGIVYWKNNLYLWCKEELEIAADLLRQDNFKVEMFPWKDDDIRIVVNW